MPKKFRACPTLTSFKNNLKKFIHVRKCLDKKLEKFRTPHNLDKFRKQLDKLRTPLFTDGDLA